MGCFYIKPIEWVRGSVSEAVIQFEESMRGKYGLDDGVERAGSGVLWISMQQPSRNNSLLF